MHEPLGKYWHYNVELSEVLANMFLRSFGLAMVTVFIPLFFLEKGLTLTQILVEYFVVMYSIVAVMNLFAVYVIRTIGLKHTIVSSIPFLIAQLIMLQSYPTLGPHWLIAAFGGVALSLYWVALHTDFTISTDKRKEGAESGIMFVAVRFAQVLGPLFGGLLIVTYGFPTLFLIALGLISFSAFPLLQTADKKIPERKAWTKYANAENARYAVRFFVDGFLTVLVGVMWPILIYSRLGSFIDVGAAGSLLIFGSAVFAALLGRVSDKTGSRRLLKLFALPLALLVYFMPLATTGTQIFLISLAIGVVAVSVEVPIYRSFVRHAKKNDIVGYTLFRETISNLGKIACLVIIATSVDQIGTGFYIGSFLGLLLAL